MDVALEFKLYDPDSPVLIPVSILVLVDVALEFTIGNYIVVPRFVSILVLVDVALESVKLADKCAKAYVFQSLF